MTRPYFKDSACTILYCIKLILNDCNIIITIPIVIF